MKQYFFDDDQLNNLLKLTLFSSFYLNVKQPFNFRLTMWKPSHFYTGLEKHSLTKSWRTFTIEQKILGVKMEMINDKMFVKVYSDGFVSDTIINKLKKRITRSYGINDEYYFTNFDYNENINSIIKKLYGMRMSCPENLFEISVISLLLQNTTIKRTTSMLQNLLYCFGRVVEFDNVLLYSFFFPEDIINVDQSFLKETCKLGYRSKYILNFAKFFYNNCDDELYELCRDDLLVELQNINGVGPYTANVIASHVFRNTSSIALDCWNRKILSNYIYGESDMDPILLQKNMEKDFSYLRGIISLYVIESEYLNNPVVPLINDEHKCKQK